MPIRPRPFGKGLRASIVAAAGRLFVGARGRAAAADPPPAGPAGGEGGVPSPRPKIAFDRETQDWGVVRQEQDLTTEFTIRNDGDAVLHVKEVKADCGCSNPRLAVKEIAPGASAALGVVFHTFTFTGPMSKRVKVTTDDPDRPEVVLRLLLDVSAGIVLEPRSLYFGPMRVGTDPTASVNVKWKDGVGRPFRLTAVEAPGMDVAFATKALEAPPYHGFTVSARFSKPPGIGTVSGTALLRTDDPDYPRIAVPVTAFVSGKVWLDLRTVSVGMVPHGRGRVLAVGCRGFAPDVALGEVTAVSRTGRVEATATRVAGKTNEWTIQVRLPEAAAPGRVDDVVEVRSAVTDEPPAEIRVTGEVLPKRGG